MFNKRIEGNKIPMNRFLSTVVIVYLFSLISGSLYAQTLSLNDAINTALANNPLIKQYVEKNEQKQFENLNSWGNFLPKINISGSYNHLNDPMEINLEPIRQAMITLQSKNQVEFANIYSLLQTQTPLNDQQKAALLGQYTKQLNSLLPEFRQSLKEQNYYSASITAIQPLFMGGKLLAAKNYASLELQSSEIELKRVRDDISKETIQSYLTIVLLKDLVLTRQHVLDGMLKHKARAEGLYKEGLIANYNLLRASVAVAEAEKNLFDDQKKLELAYINFKNLLNMPQSETIEVEGTLEYKEKLDSMSVYYENALNSHHLIKLLETKSEAANQKYNLERSRFLPQLAAFGKYELYPEYLSALEPRWIVGVQASFNIFNGLQDYSALQSAKHLENEVKYIQSDVRNKLGLLVNKNYHDVLTAKEKYARLLPSLELMEENLRLNEKRFDTGLGTSLDVIDARLILEKNIIDKKVTLFEYYKNLSELYYVSGKIEQFTNFWNN